MRKRKIHQMYQIYEKEKESVTCIEKKSKKGHRSCVIQKI